MWFALSLPLGVAGLNEILELELTDPLSADEVHARLAAHAPPGLEFLSVEPIEPRASARVRRAWYRLQLPGPIAGLTSRCRDFLEQSDCWIERRRPQLRRVNIRPFVDVLCVYADRIETATWVTPNGSARAEEVFVALGLSALLDAGAVIERTDLEVYDELPAGVSEAPVITSVFEEAKESDTGSKSDRPHAIFDNPMSFDT